MERYTLCLLRCDGEAEDARAAAGDRGEAADAKVKRKRKQAVHKMAAALKQEGRGELGTPCKRKRAQSEERQRVAR